LPLALLLLEGKPEEQQLAPIAMSEREEEERRGHTARERTPDADQPEFEQGGAGPASRG
ncbi:unnamed protein product, partial [Urochloa humidicola]